MYRRRFWLKLCVYIINLILTSECARLLSLIRSDPDNRRCFSFLLIRMDFVLGQTRLRMAIYRVVSMVIAFLFVHG